MEKLDDYFKLQKEIYEYFGYVEDWVVLPIDDRRELYWHIDSNETEVIFTTKRETMDQLSRNDYNYEFIEEEYQGDVYSDEIYTQRFLPKWIYRGAEYTMVVVDTLADGNRFLAIFSNDKSAQPEEGSEQ